VLFLTNRKTGNEKDSKNIFSTCAHSGEEKGAFLDSIVPPLFETVNFYFEDFKEARDYFTGVKTDRYYYSRLQNPTTEILEKKMAAMEGTPACKCFASGMGAIGIAVLGVAGVGDHAICVNTVYKNTHRIFSEVTPCYGITTSFVRGLDINEFEQAVQPKTKLIFLESPSSSRYSMQDLQAIAEMAKSKGIITMIDNTYDK